MNNSENMESLKYGAVTDKKEQFNGKSKLKETETNSVSTQLNLDFSKVENQLKAAAQNSNASRSAKLPPAIVNEVLEAVRKEGNFNNLEEAASVVAVLCQRGGVAKNCDGNLDASDVFNKPFKLAQLRKVLKKTKQKGNIRKLARSLAGFIVRTGTTMALPGNLYKKIATMVPEEQFSPQDKAYLSDFQLENDALPLRLKKLILASYGPSQSKRQNNKKTGK